jgi:hypothetical protein
MREDIGVNPKIKLAALWTSVMFCYIYADYFGLFAPGLLWKMNQGLIPPLGRATDTVLIGASLMMAIPALMIFLSVALRAPVNRILNIVFGLVYSGIIGFTMTGGSKHFLVYGVIEIALTLLVVYYAWTWPSHAELQQG